MKIPFSISIYEFAAALIDRTPWDVSRSTDLLYEAHHTAFVTYRHFPVVVGIDIYNLEAEAYGGRVTNPGGSGIPAITAPLCASIDEVMLLPAVDPRSDGRLAMHVDVASKLARERPDAHVCVPVSGPFSVLLSLVGVETASLSAALRPECTRDALAHLARNQVIVAEEIARRDVDVAFFESGAAPPLLSPALFRDVELPPLKALIQRVATIVGHPVPCIIGGDTAPILPEIMSTGTGFVICPAETDRNAFVSQMVHYPGVKTRVNLPASIYTRGTRQQILAEIDSVVELAAGDPNILLGTGALPYETSRQNLRFMLDYVAS